MCYWPCSGLELEHLSGKIALSVFCNYRKDHDQFLLLFRIVGAISGFAYNYTFPCLVYLAALKAAGQLTKRTLFLHTIIVVFGVLNLIGQFIIPV